MILKILTIIHIVVTTILLTNCQEKQKIQTGESFTKVDGGKIWYRVTGTDDKTPILLLYGRPGVPSYYLKHLSALGVDRKVIFFDQLGCGKSDHNSDTTLITIDHFVEEAKTVVHHFGLTEFYLYGRSWGNMLGTDYYLKYPEGIKALILSSPGISIPMWIKKADTLLSTLPDSIQNAVKINEQTKSYKFEIIEGAGHLTMQDQPEQSNTVVINFLNNLEIK